MMVATVNDAGRWVPGIGDPTVIGWLTVIAYFVACLGCARAFKAEKRTPDRVTGLAAYADAMRSLLMLLRRERFHLARAPRPAQAALFWASSALALLCLGINKQLDLQTLFTQIGKDLALSQGWYAHRRPVQIAFIIAILILVIIIARHGWMLFRQHPRPVRQACLGLTVLAGFIVIRAASFHHFDAWLGFVADRFRLNWVLELGGIAIVGHAAWKSTRDSAPK